MPFDRRPYYKTITVMDWKLFALIAAFMCTSYSEGTDQNEQNKSSGKK